jgi:hypothetical protein
MEEYQNRASTQHLKEVLGTTQSKKENGWFDQNCQTALDIRNEARKKM